MDSTRSPWPLIEIAIEPRFGRERTKLVACLVEMAEQYPVLRVADDAVSGQIILGGCSERQIDVAIDGLRREHRIEIAVGAPRVAYRETMTRRIEKDYTYKKQVLGVRQFARLKLVFEPGVDTVGTVFFAAVVGGSVPAAFVPGVEAGIASVARSGVLAGFPVVGVKATLIDGAYHDVDSSALAFEIAARTAFREALGEGDPALLEPIMRVEATAPTAYHGALTGDLGARGRVETESMRGETIVVTALVSLANLFGYEHQVRSLTQGHGTYEMRFVCYRPVPPRGGGWPPPAAAAALRA